MKEKEAISLLLEGKLKRVGVKRAVFADIPGEEPIEWVWFDLVDQDHNARLENGSLYMDIWYCALPNLPEDSFVDKREIQTPKGLVTLFKFRMMVELDYISLDGKRIWLN
ncbi:hypothetical protein [Paenibacillus polymyxa]|uniref:Uncharacterized protein n=1 Tax=Paenibacillus polymyxa (strain SC2) TaxID=886882 RepID=E3EJN8_PAEPS|nr:hypothetical protein [Paenibacillus polymyxa]ADO59636.1 hypothetical protein PPSC2_26955 [Paenibacillus polymyxa SC2]WPQ59538.1 hypothetical protein SKN87_28150 [Paenibacillus polymyxa]